MQHIQFPQDVNTEPFNEVEAYFVYGLTNAAIDPLSLKQAFWLVGVARSVDWNPQGIAYGMALARRGGSDLEPFEASDDDLAQDANRIFDEGVAAYLRVTGGLQ